MHFYIRLFDNPTNFRRLKIKSSTRFSVAFTKHKQIDMSPVNDLGLSSTSEMIKMKPIIPQYFFLLPMSP